MNVDLEISGCLSRVVSGGRVEISGLAKEE